MASWSSRRAGFRRYSFSSILQNSIHWFQACCDTFSYTRFPSSVSNGGSSRPGKSFCNLTQKTRCSGIVSSESGPGNYLTRGLTNWRGQLEQKNGEGSG